MVRLIWELLEEMDGKCLYFSSSLPSRPCLSFSHTPVQHHLPPLGYENVLLVTLLCFSSLASFSFSSVCLILSLSFIPIVFWFPKITPRKDAFSYLRKRTKANELGLYQLDDVRNVVYEVENG